LRTLPGVDSVGGTNAPPLAGGQADGTFVELTSADEVTSFDDFDALADDPERVGQAEFRVASEGYFATLGIPLLAGRLFAPSDSPEAAHAAVISRSLAERQWPGRDPIGRLVEFGNMDGDLTPFTIVGIVGDVRDYGLAAEPRPTFYGYYRQRPRKIAFFWVALHAPDPERIAPLARGVVQSMNSEVPPELRAADELYAAALAPQRFNLVLLGAFGVVTLLLALAGIYGAMTFNVAQRRQEIGVRIALGAQTSSVVNLVVRESLVIAGIGVAAGLLLAFVGARLLASLLFGIAPRDPATFAAVAAGLLCAALGAAWVPARRAAAVDPISVLRQE
jgi:predicted permease